ncbi:hypothetical protein ACH5RR_013204 [Cinchona calisaya]|uniref:UBN2 domain-containing protein n=1 Tax=Cinchona calisaya TaxID=153742 RepID=A0ABD2ZZH8_9GENT
MGKENKSEKLSDEKFANLDKKAKSGIVLNLSDEVLREVASESTAKGMWDKLKDLYMKKIMVNRLYLKQSLYMIRITEAAPPSSISKLLSAAVQMSDANNENVVITITDVDPPEHDNPPEPESGPERDKRGKRK